MQTLLIKYFLEIFLITGIEHKNNVKQIVCTSNLAMARLAGSSLAGVQLWVWTESKGCDVDEPNVFASLLLNHPPNITC